MHTPSHDSDSPKRFRIVAVDGPHAIPGRPHIVLSRKTRGPDTRRRLALADSGLLGDSGPAVPVPTNLKVLRPEPAEAVLRPEAPGDIIALRQRRSPPAESPTVRLSDEPDGAA